MGFAFLDKYDVQACANLCNARGAGTALRLPACDHQPSVVGHGHYESGDRAPEGLQFADMSSRVGRRRYALCGPQEHHREAFGSVSSVCMLYLDAVLMASVALASQSLSIMISLIPYIRETFRRHLSPKQAVMLVEFDKLKRVRFLNHFLNALHAIASTGLPRTPKRNPRKTHRDHG